MSDIRLALEDSPQKAGQLGVDVNDLLKLVEDQRHSAAPIRAELRRNLKQLLDRGVDVGGVSSRSKGESDQTGVRVQTHGWLEAQAPEGGGRLLPNPIQRRGDVLVDRARQGGGKRLPVSYTHLTLP